LVIVPPRAEGSRNDEQQAKPTLGDKSFESIKQANAHGAEYWSARDLQLLLGYSQWRRFEQAIERAVSSCQ
jgi:DNA-damage-inducible protein D